jgi:hypothetical protein
MAPIPPFGSPPFQLTAAKLAALGVVAATPVVMSKNFTIPAQSQVLFKVPITMGSYQIIGGAGSILAGVET